MISFFFFTPTVEGATSFDLLFFQLLAAELVFDGDDTLVSYCLLQFSLFNECFGVDYFILKRWEKVNF